MEFCMAVIVVLSAIAQDVETLNTGRANGYVSGQIYYDVVMVRLGSLVCTSLLLQSVEMQDWRGAFLLPWAVCNKHTPNQS